MRRTASRPESRKTDIVDILRIAQPIPSDTPALFGPGGSWTRMELDAAVAAEVRRLGNRVGPGHLRPLTVEPDPGGLLALLATWRAGAIPVPLSPRLTGAERDRAVAVLDSVRASDAMPRETAVILWTSGTSGRPRGVALSRSNLRAMTEAVAERLQLGPDDTWLASLSPAHVGGLALVVRALLLGSPLVAPGRFTVGEAVESLRGTEAAPPVTHLSLVPTQFLRLLDAWPEPGPPDTLRCVLLGGAATPPDLLRRGLDAGWPISLTYGMTEMTSQVATTTPEETRERPGSVGRPLSGVRLQIAEDGEILVRGPTLAVGLPGGEAPLVDDRGWYHTGDLGRVNDDGWLRVDGRKSDRIISGGVTVDPREVEHTLALHPSVREVCVVGVPDPEWGERVVAVVVPTGGGLDQSLLEDWAGERLGAARLPRAWKVVADLPVNRNGKVDRAGVLALLEGSETL